MRRKATQAELLRALDDLEREINFGPPLDESELDDLLAEVEADAEANLLACVILFGLDREMVEERAGIMQYDGGLARVSANRRAFVTTLRARQPGISEELASAFFNHAADILDVEIANGWSRQQTIDALISVLSRKEAMTLRLHAEAV